MNSVVALFSSSSVLEGRGPERRYLSCEIPPPLRIAMRWYGMGSSLTRRQLSRPLAGSLRALLPLQPLSSPVGESSLLAVGGSLVFYCFSPWLASACCALIRIITVLLNKQLLCGCALFGITDCLYIHVASKSSCALIGISIL